MRRQSCQIEEKKNQLISKYMTDRNGQPSAGWGLHIDQAETFAKWKNTDKGYRPLKLTFRHPAQLDWKYVRNLKFDRFYRRYYRWLYWWNHGKQ